MIVQELSHLASLLHSLLHPICFEWQRVLVQTDHIQVLELTEASDMQKAPLASACQRICSLEKQSFLNAIMMPPERRRSDAVWQQCHGSWVQSPSNPQWVSCKHSRT